MGYTTTPSPPHKNTYDDRVIDWPSRDPIGESGGINLYGFCLNRPITGYDYLGNGFIDWVTGNEGWIPGNQGAWLDGLVEALDEPVGDNGHDQGDWVDAIGNLEDWLQGNTPENTDYPSGSAMSDSMITSPQGMHLMSEYLQKMEGKKCSEYVDYTNVIVPFGASEFLRALPNGTASFVGSARGDVTVVEIKEEECLVKVKFVLTNTTSLKSGLYHLIPNSWNNTNTGTSGANWTQTYTWEEEISCKP